VMFPESWSSNCNSGSQTKRCSRTAQENLALTTPSFLSMGHPPAHVELFVVDGGRDGFRDVHSVECRVKFAEIDTGREPSRFGPGETWCNPFS